MPDRMYENIDVGKNGEVLNKTHICVPVDVNCPSLTRKENVIGMLLNSVRPRLVFGYRQDSIKTMGDQGFMIQNYMIQGLGRPHTASSPRTKNGNPIISVKVKDYK